jgi:hypothetical protein
MRIIMVPKDETYQSPPIEVKEPDDDREGLITLSEEFVSKINH